MGKKLRWNSDERKDHETPLIDVFLKEVIELSKKHGYSISHEDGHGSFIVTSYNEQYSKWLNDAHVSDLYNKHNNYQGAKDNNVSST